MTPADVITVAVCMLFSAGVLSLLVKPVMELRAHRRAPTPLAPQSAPCAISRTARLQFLNAIWHNLDQGFINQQVGLHEVQFADLHEVTRLFPDDLEVDR